MTALSRFFCRFFPAFLALLAVLPVHAAFTDHGDGTVTDSVTGLMWDKCSWGQSNNTDCSGGAASTHSWLQALGVAVTANAMNGGVGYKGYADWRLPSRNELESLVKIDASSPAIDATAFPNTPSNWFWSSTTYVPVPALAWVVDFGNGGTFAVNKTHNDHVRLVRSGQSFAAFDRFADLAAPVYQSATLNAGNTVATLTFDEALVNNLADLAALKAAVTFAADGAAFSALAGGDAVALSGSTLAVTFATPLTGSTNKVKIAANSLKDAGGNVLASAVTTGALTANDIAAPAYQSAALDAGLTVATLTFDEALVNNKADLPTLKAAVTFASDGATFGALAAGDAVALSGSTLAVTFAGALSGAANKIKVAANSLKDAAGNVLASAVTTAALDATDTTPNAFAFTAQSGAALSTVTASNAITVTGINSAANISISGGEYRIGSGGWTSGAGTVNNGDTVTARLTSSASHGTAATATLTIGGVSAVFSVTTQAAPSHDPGPPSAPTVINAPGGVETTLNSTTPVTAAPGSTLVIPAGANVAGVAITLPAPSGGASSSPVMFRIGGLTLTVTANSANTVVTLKKVTINGVETLVLAVTSGNLALSAAAGQPLLTLNGSATLTAGEHGGTVSFSAGSDGSGSIAVTGGYVVLSANAFAAANGFAALKDGKVYAGEVAGFDSAGKVAGVRLGSLAGDGGAVGDPLKDAGAAAFLDKTVVPNLKGKAARVSSEREFTDVLAAALGAEFTSRGQNADGVLRLAFAGGAVNAIPVGILSVDTARADGITRRGDGLVDVAVGGVVATFAPALASLGDLKALLPAGAVLSLSAEGVLGVSHQGTRYWARPAWLAAKGGGAAGLSQTASGVSYCDGKGDCYALMPAFANYAALLDVIAQEISGAVASANPDGGIAMTVQGKAYTLVPRMAQPESAATDAMGHIMSGKRWWRDAAGRLFLNAGGVVQEFVVQ